jgi:oligopeptide/dipeptide ABC transporter ATP-binding protein
MNRDPLLSIQNLSAGFHTDDGFVTAVDDISFDVPRGRITGLVGESGCGKSVTAMSIMRLLPHPSGVITGGSILLENENLATAPEERLWSLRGRRMGMIFQEPMTALNPVQTIGRQLSEVFLLHEKCPPSEARNRSIEVLRRVRIPSPEIRYSEYPHQLSGGMRQRVVIALALALKPALLIADEPTTALDVTVQAQILDLIREIQAESGMAVLLITHDLGVIAEMCHEVVVMYGGRIAERAPATTLFAHPRHAYTKGLLASIPRLDSIPGSRLPTIEGSVPPLALMPKGCRFCARNTSAPGLPLSDIRPDYKLVAPDHWLETCRRCAPDF